MTVERLSPETLELRYFVDALRGALGLQPLYFTGQQTEQERFGGAEVPLPHSGKPDEWFRPVAYAPDERVQDKSVELQMKKLSSAGHREKIRQDRAYAWRAKTQLDPSVRGYASIEGRMQFSRKAY